MRVYFHLRKAHAEVLLDVEGVEVAGPQEARLLTLRALERLCENQDDAPYESGWTLIAVDAAGHQLFTLDLDRSSRDGKAGGSGTTIGWH